MKKYSASEINLLQKQVVPTLKINLSMDELIDELRAAFNDVRFQVVISQTEKDRFTLNHVIQDEELLIAQYEESKQEREGYKIKFIDPKTDCSIHGKDMDVINVSLPEISGKDLCVKCFDEKMAKDNLWSKYSSK